MIQIYKISKKQILIFLIFSLSFFLFSDNNWIIGAQRFVNQRGKNTSVTDGIGEMLSTRILEKLSTNLYRNISEEENLYKTVTALKTERTSLFLQLSNEIKKRDSFVIGNYTKKELEKKIEEQEKSIGEIQKKIDENLKNQKELEDKIAVSKKNNKLTVKEDDTNNNFFMDLFSSSENNDSIEKVVLYKQDFESLFVPTKTALESGYTSSFFENEVTAAGINGLITGSMKIYGEYFSVTVELYVYPGAYKVATVTEVGSLPEADLVSSLIARELTPSITNSLPVQINLTISPEEIKNKVSVYLDNELVKNGSDGFVTDSGVHLLQFVCDSYNTVSTSYGFTGNRTYDVSVNMEKEIVNNITLQLPVMYPGSVFLRGLSYKTNEDGQTGIKINNQQVLGIFVSENNDKAFFVISEKDPLAVQTLSLNVKPFNRSEYIEKQRRRMYTSYSILITSLIPTFVTMGQANSYNLAYYNGTLASNQMGMRTAWNISQYACTGVTVGCGIWFVYELVRYFIAADSVLPVEAKAVNNQKIEE